MKKLPLVVALAALPLCAVAAEKNTSELPESAQSFQSSCADAGGYFQYGTVNAPPESDYPEVTNFTSGKKLHGVHLSHTHIEITSLIDNSIYDVAIDNVFAKDFDRDARKVPESYRKHITAGATLYFCGGNPTEEPYSINGKQYAQNGFDWVHTNCETPGSKFSNGWLKTADGLNLSNGQKYCYLWNK